MSTTLLALLLGARWCAVDAAAGVPVVLHAATVDTLREGYRDGTMHAPCGASVMLLPWPWPHGDPVPWPPQARMRGVATTRCRECWVATGRKRPACRIEAKAPVS